MGIAELVLSVAEGLHPSYVTRKKWALRHYDPSFLKNPSFSNSSINE
jgi:hypothetical protein